MRRLLGGFLIRNSPWGRTFVDHWLALTVKKAGSRKYSKNCRSAKDPKECEINMCEINMSAKDPEKCDERTAVPQYPFTDNGAFAETALRFGSWGMPLDCQYKPNTCLTRISRIKAGTDKKARDKKASDWVACLGETKNELMGSWNRTRNRDLGRVRFVATAQGFNSRGLEEWKGNTGRTRGSFFQDGMFVLHNKDFKDRVPSSSVTCYQAEDATSAIARMFRTTGSFMLSKEGFCDLDSVDCRREHFTSCTGDLTRIMGNKAIRNRVELLKGCTHVFTSARSWIT